MRLLTIPTSILLAGFALVSGSALLCGQTADAVTSKKIFGYQDAQTGVFHSVPREDLTNTSTTTQAGTLKVTLNITVKSAWPAGTTRTIACSSFFEMNAQTTTGSTNYTEEASSNATGSAGVFTCTMTIPYSWQIPTTAISKMLTGSYSVGVENSTLTAGPPILRLSSSGIVSTPTLPATGTTTTYTIAVVI